ncbi:MAG: efflux RND transporter periplasmic adaptor subunit [Opitutales bacterium]|nr:efflux RND transporter periplasmic adaptor subunit [Opitutales bacterium]
MKLQKKFISVAALSLLAAFPFAGTGCEKVLNGGNATANLPAVPTVKATPRTIEENIIVSGFVEPETATEIKSEINGKIIRINVENGDNVKQNDLLLEIDASTYQTEVDAAERTERQRELDVEKSRRDMLRIKELYENDFATEQDYLDAVTHFETAQLQLEVVRSSLAKAREELSKTQIRAPHDGMVSNLDVFVGNVISGAGSFSNGTTLMKINDMKNLRVEADLNEIEVNKIGLNSDAELSFDSLPGTSFVGKVDYLSPFGVQDSATSTLYKFPVRVKFQAGTQLIRPGISSNISILVSRAENAVSVPASAIFLEDDRRFVFVKLGEHRFERRYVEIGVGNLNFIEIKNGIAEGDEIAITRPSQSEIVGGNSDVPAKKRERSDRRGGNDAPPPPM